MENIKKKLFVSELKDKSNQLVRIVLMLVYKEKKYTKNENLFFYLKMQDKTGIINARIFNPEDKENILDFEMLKIGDFYEILGNYDKYGLNIKKIRSVIISEDDKNEFIIAPKIDTESLYSIIKEKIDNIKNNYLKKLLEIFFNDSDFVDKFKNWPSASVHHHNYQSGNLEHTVGVVRLVESLSDFYKLDKDLLITGAILHDIGKFYTYDIKGLVISENDKGKFIGHIMYSYNMIKDNIDKIADFPDDLKMKLLHLILSHHGQIEWGSPIEPMTPEAMALHLSDLADSRVKKIIQLIGNQ
ncbi:MAG: 3'-5' exoribonuclease YhaM family protein [Candidatus Helarchaeota archaeon]